MRKFIPIYEHGQIANLWKSHLQNLKKEKDFGVNFFGHKERMK